MRNLTIKSPGRRRFLQTVPVAAAAGFTLTDVTLFAASATAQDAAAGAATFHVYRAEEIEDDAKALTASPGNKSLADWKNLTAVLTVETAKSGKEFEWHEGRDHVFHILDGSTVYELGGTPKGGHNTKPGEWLAPESEGASKMTLNKGDILVVPRGTPHKRSTAGSVTFLLISAQNPA